MQSHISHQSMWSVHSAGPRIILLHLRDTGSPKRVYTARYRSAMILDTPAPSFHIRNNITPSIPAVALTTTDIPLSTLHFLPLPPQIRDSHAAAFDTPITP